MLVLRVTVKSKCPARAFNSDYSLLQPTQNRRTAPFGSGPSVLSQVFITGPKKRVSITPLQAFDLVRVIKTELMKASINFGIRYGYFQRVHRHIRFLQSLALQGLHRGARDMSTKERWPVFTRPGIAGETACAKQNTKHVDRPGRHTDNGGDIIVKMAAMVDKLKRVKTFYTHGADTKRRGVLRRHSAGSVWAH